MNKWRFLSLLWLAFFLHQGTRQIYNAMLPQIKSSLGADAAMMGLVGTVFTWVYGLSVPLAGIIGDKVSRKWVVITGLLVFSSGIFLSGWVTLAGLLILFYSVINGAGQGFYFPPSCSLLGQLFDERSRSTAFSIHQTAMYIGIIALSSAAGWIAGLGAETWRIAFKIFGAVGIVWAVVLMFFVEDVKAPPVTGEKQPGLLDGVKVMFSTPTAIFLAFALGMEIYVDQGFKTWMATFFQERGFSPTAAGFHCVFWHYVGAFIGVLAGSRFADRVAAKHPAVRPLTIMAGLLLGAPFIFAMAQVTSLPLCYACLFLFGLFRGVYDSNNFATLYEVVPARFRASATGVMLFIGFLLGGFAPMVLGLIKERFSLATGISSLSAFFLVGGLLIFVAQLFFFRKDHKI